MAFGPAIAGRIVRRGELHVLRARPRKLARARADVRGTCSVCRSLDAQPGPCSRPARRTVPSKMQFIQKSGLGIRPGTRSLDRGRAPHNSFLSRDGATGEAGVDGGANTRDALPRSDPISPKSSVLAQKFAAFDLTSKLSALERVRSAAMVIDATGRSRQTNTPAQDLLGDDFSLVQGRPAARDPASNRRLQQLVSSVLHTAPGGAQAYAPIVVDRDEAPWLWSRQCRSLRSAAICLAPVARSFS
jgi:hypothetical protein